MRVSFRGDEVACICGRTGTLAIAKTLGSFFYLETESEETVLFTEPDDLMVASSFATGEKATRSLKCTLFQLRELGAPLIVLPKGHPASRRLKVVVSIGPRTRLSCEIQPGTHPEQDVLCGSCEFGSLQVLAAPGGAILEGFEPGMGEIIIERL